MVIKHLKRNNYVLFFLVCPSELCLEKYSLVHDILFWAAKHCICYIAVLHYIALLLTRSPTLRTVKNDTLDNLHSFILISTDEQYHVIPCVCQKNSQTIKRDQKGERRQVIKRITSFLDFKGKKKSNTRNTQHSLIFHIIFVPKQRFHFKTHPSLQTYPTIASKQVVSNAAIQTGHILLLFFISSGGNIT